MANFLLGCLPSFSSPHKVIDTVPLGDVDDGMFDYFVPLYEMIPDMPQPPETFLKKLTGQTPPKRASAG